jgi:allene oxide cyclase
MTTSFLRRALVFSSLAMAGFAAAVAPAAAGGSISLDLVERAASDTVIDTGAKGDSAGDILTFANDLYDKANKTKVGDDNGWCMRTLAGKAWECVATLTLADGQVTVEGPFLDGKDSVWAVTGGTGKHMAARGDMQLHARNAEGSAYDMKFRLTK